MKRLLLLAVLAAAACSRSTPPADPVAATVAGDMLVTTSDANRFAEQSYLEGVADYEKGDLSSAAEKFSRCLTLVTTGQTAGGCLAGLQLTRGMLEHRGAVPALPAVPAPRTGPAGHDDAAASQAFLAGMIYFQKGDYEKARGEWTRCLQLSAPNGPSSDDCRAGLQRVAQLLGPGSTAPDGKK